MTNELAAAALLKTASMLRCERRDGEVAVSLAGRVRTYRPEAFAILGVFATARTFKDGLELLGREAAGRRAWMDLAGTALQLLQDGFLERADGETGKRPAHPSLGFGKPGIHIAMLDDHLRTDAYLAAIKQVVRTGDVVVDLGTGTGVFAVAAAQAGARTVYAIEESRMADVAASVFEVNGVADVVQLVRERSTSVELPELADVLVAEIVGNDPLDERLLESTDDARRRFLKPGARLIPNRLGIWARPLTVPAETLQRHLFRSDHVREWNRRYGMDFAPLVDATANSAVVFKATPKELAGWPSPVPDIQLADLDLAQAQNATLDVHGTAPSTTGGVVNAIALFATLRLSQAVTLSTGAPAPVNHWRLPIQLVSPALVLDAGDLMSVRYRYGYDDRLAGVEVVRLVSPPGADSQLTR